MSGVHHDGGYAESVIAIPSGLASIPDNFGSADAAPMLCAGVTMFNALRRSSAEPGDLVAVQGVGGLGHLALQFAARMGFRVAAIARGPEKEEFARQLGADHYIDSKAGDPVAVLQALGGAKVIVATASDSKSMSEFVDQRLDGGGNRLLDLHSLIQAVTELRRPVPDLFRQLAFVALQPLLQAGQRAGRSGGKELPNRPQGLEQAKGVGASLRRLVEKPLYEVRIDVPATLFVNGPRRFRATKP
jgi:threonine dehydrogenase-like Zn-dependent dehydrogenase